MEEQKIKTKIKLKPRYTTIFQMNYNNAKKKIKEQIQTHFKHGI